MTTLMIVLSIIGSIVLGFIGYMLIIVAMLAWALKHESMDCPRCGTTHNKRHLHRCENDYADFIATTFGGRWE